MNKRSSLLAFMLGIVVGSTITWQMIKDRYERRIEEDRKSLEEMYAEKVSTKVQPVEEMSVDLKEIAKQAKAKPDIGEYAKRLQNEGYVNYVDNSGLVVDIREPNREDVVDVPYVIPPDEFGELDGYDRISLTYFADGVLADEDNEPIDNVEEIVGNGLEYFGEYEEDSVFVRNDAKKCDYEILKDLREFSEILAEFPPR